MLCTYFNNLASVWTYYVNNSVKTYRDDEQKILKAIFNIPTYLIDIVIDWVHFSDEHNYNY